MKNHNQRTQDYEGLLAFAEQLSGAEMTSKQKRMAKTIIYGETFHSASAANKKAVLAFAALYYAEKVEA